MQRAIKKKAEYIQAYQLGVGDKMEQQLIKEGKLIKLENGTYKLSSQKTANGSRQKAEKEDYVKVDKKEGEDFLYLFKKEWFEQHYKPLNRKGLEDTFEQIILPVEILKIDESNPKESFTGDIDGEKISVSRGEVVVILGKNEDGSTDFCRMDIDTFNEEYTVIPCFNFVSKTKGISDPGDITDLKGKNLIYFTCHPDDFDGYFDDIREKILRLHEGCAICFKTHPAEILDKEELESLENVSVFVIPVTYNFLEKDSFARNDEYAYARRKKKPVLFWMEENDGLKEKFDHKYPGVHFFDKEAEENDANMFNAKEKLERFLSTYLLNDKLLTNITTTFGDNYIFLSYRRDDRKIARTLMNKIHQQEFCWDTAIWYDEFLIYGEDFNEKIQEIIEKSRLFVLAVTPKLLELPNYVQENEYPAAKNAKINEKIMILPIEITSTEWEDLKQYFDKDIEKPINVTDEEALKNSLWTKAPRSEILEQDADSNHLLYVGLAYLRGIDVEINPKKGRDMISQAAEKGNVVAIEWMAQMYKVGDTVKQSPMKEIYWQRKLVAYWENKFNASHSENAAKELADAYGKLGTVEFNIKHNRLSREAFQKMVTMAMYLFLNFPESESQPEYSHLFWKSLLNMGVIHRTNENLEEAEIWDRLGLGVIEGKSIETRPGDSRLYCVFNYRELGKLSLKKGNVNEAEEWVEKAVELNGKLYEELNQNKGKSQQESHASNVLNNLAFCYRQKGDIETAKGNENAADEWYQAAREKREERIRLYGDETEKKQLASCYEKEGYDFIGNGNYDKACERYKKSYDLRMYLANTYPGRWEEYVELSDCCKMLCNSYAEPRENVNLDKMRFWYEKALEAEETALSKNSTDESLMANLAIDYFWSLHNGIDEKKAIKNLEEAEKIWTKQISPDFPNREENLKKVRGLIKQIKFEMDCQLLGRAEKNQIRQEEVFKLGVGNSREKQLVEEGLLNNLGDGRYKVNNKYADISSDEDFIIHKNTSRIAIRETNGKHRVFPIDKNILKSAYKRVYGDIYETTVSQEVRFYTAKDEMAPIIQKLIDSGELIIDKGNPEKMFTAKRDGKEYSVPSDGVVILYGIEENGKIDFELIQAEEFKNKNKYLIKEINTAK